MQTAIHCSAHRDIMTTSFAHDTHLNCS